MKVLFSFAKFILSLRYRVQVVGRDAVRDQRGVLVLPNHPGYNDPALVLSHLWPALAPRPMLLESMFDNPLLFWLPRALGALKVPNLEQHSTEAREQAEESIAATYERFLIAIQALARQLERRIAAKKVGILLPASVAADLVIFAIHLAGKTPVMINWTTGPANLAHAARTMELTHVVSSQRFVDRIGIPVQGADYLFLEDVSKSIGKLELAWLLVRTRLAPRYLARRLPVAAAHDPAVVLFTSGSEKAPKAVSLTYANILSNLQGVLAGYELYRSDVFLGFLPPFHSFGFTLTIMLAILVEAGLRGIMRLDEVRHVEAIPVLGTGKIDYKALRRALQDTMPGQRAGGAIAQGREIRPLH